MCDPLTLGGLALSTAGAVGNAQTQNSYTNEVNRQNRIAYETSRAARDAEAVRQKDMEAEANAAYEATRNNLTRDKMDEGVDTRSQNFVQTLDAMPAAITTESRLPGQEGASVAVKEAITNRINREAADSRERIKAFSDLTAYGLTGADRAQGVSNTADFLSTLGGLRRGSLAVGQQEQEVRPADVTPGSGLLPALLSGLGGVVSMKAGYNSGRPLFGGTMSMGTPTVRPQPNPFY